MKTLFTILFLFLFFNSNAQQSSETIPLEGLWRLKYMKKVSASDSSALQVGIFKQIRSDLSFTNLSMNGIELTGTLQGKIEVSKDGTLTETILKQGPSIGNNAIGQMVIIPYFFNNNYNSLYLTFKGIDQNGVPFDYHEIYERVIIK